MIGTLSKIVRTSNSFKMLYNILVSFDVSWTCVCYYLIG